MYNDGQSNVGNQYIRQVSNDRQIDQPQKIIHTVHLHWIMIEHKDSNNSSN